MFVRLRGLLSRPLTIQREGLSFHVVSAAPRSDVKRHGVSTAELHSELGTRLQDPTQAWDAQVMRHLAAVHHVLGRQGWKGVQAMPNGLIAKALVQAEMLHADEPTPAMTTLVDRLSAIHAAAAAREGRTSVRRQEENAACVQVSEATHEEFEALEKSWTGNIPAGS
jgi:hypothetical protein